MRYLKLILSSHKLTAVNSQSSRALLPITGLKHERIEHGVKIRKRYTFVQQLLGHVSSEERKFTFDN